MDSVTEIVTVVETVEVPEAAYVIKTIETLSLLETSIPEVITDVVQDTELVTEILTEGITEEVQVVEIITEEGRQGPPGPPGIAEEDIVYAKRVDMVSSELLYRGEAAVGSSEDAPVWRIRRLQLHIHDGLVDLSEQWANGAAEFSNRWSERDSLTYA